MKPPHANNHHLQIKRYQIPVH